MNVLKNFLREERGQDLVEYTLLIVAGAFVGLGLWTTLGPTMKNQWTDTGTALANARNSSS